MYKLNGVKLPIAAMKEHMKLLYNGKTYNISRGTLLSELFKRENLDIPMVCAGMGRCGKCKVRFVSGAPRATSADNSFLSEDEIKSGWRLACRAVITEDAEIETDLSTAKEDKAFNIKEESREDKCEDLSSGNFVAAIDIGTTTIAAAIISPKDGNDIIKKAVTMNHQRSYGADVISRIKAANEGNADELRRLVTDDLKGLLKNVALKEVVIAGNTTMLHLLVGDSCEGLGISPYKPVRLSYPEMSFSEVLGVTFEEKDIYDETECRLMPGISAFVGADIVSGMYALDFYKIPEGKTYMLIDLGTNGEMAVADSEKITVCSTAAGPVFEGGGISCGMAGVSGAIEHIKIDKEKKTADYRTIENTEPIGICGSGVLELVSELRRCDIVDETGLLVDEYFEEGFILYKDEKKTISFSQNDIRALQLAKAAIRSGIDTLLSEHGITSADVDKVYIAGGFSEHLDIDMIKTLKMLPEEFLNKNITECVGNTSLKGCIMAIGDCDYQKKITDIAARSSEISLAGTDTFGESFISAMNL
ncbi:Uncharacterized 2Fe-2 and 4Fe-4S clusters-containing protein, contains DUF4445 domain [Butyrivibrio sp. INlla16]|nr:Uncharacterized 2Fe-2 and 4Fe-4S clusters-containing protein, contains DUF4445 domain [Butyrivibrio sp. INlla16]